MQQARSALRIAELEVSKQKGAYLPTVTADAGYVWQKTAFPTDRYGYAALRFVVPIWQSGEISSRVAFARERERQARLLLEEQLRTVQEDVRRALLDLQTATTSLALSEDQLRAAEAEYQQVADLYRSQEATSLDIQSLGVEPLGGATGRRREPAGTPPLRARGALRRRRSQVRRPQGGPAVTFRPRAVLLLLALAEAGCGRAPQRAETSATPHPLPADVRSVEALAAPRAPDAPGTDALVAGGRLALTGEFVAPVRSDLVPRTGGRVARVLADEGQLVRKGQPLLEMETDYVKLDLARAEADLARANAAAKDAERDFDRKKGLATKGSVSQATYDRSQAGAEQATASRAAAQAALDTARQRLADAVLTSPVDGVVAARRTDVGERLGESTVAFVVEQTAPLKLRFRVPERYLASVKAGQAVKATVDPYPGTEFEGTLSLVGGSMDSATRTFLAEAEFANRDRRLRPGLFARVSLDVGAN